MAPRVLGDGDGGGGDNDYDDDCNPHTFVNRTVGDISLLNEYWRCCYGNCFR